MRGMLVVACAALSLVMPAEAVELSQKGTAVLIQGAIKDGDHFRLRDFLARPEAAQIRTVYLDSPGGRIDPAREMARQIREKGYTTVVDAARGRCESACTGLFVAGSRRLYLNAGAIRDGEGKMKRGIGFHEGNSSQRAGGRGYSGSATSGMINIYYEMGVPGAASLVTKAAFNGMYYVSVQTALSLGIATGSSDP